MKKTLLLLCLLACGCGRGYEFKYEERVFIHKGFYRDRTATVVDSYDDLSYMVKLEDGRLVFVRRAEMYPIDEDR